MKECMDSKESADHRPESYTCNNALENSPMTSLFITLVFVILFIFLHCWRLSLLARRRFFIIIVISTISLLLLFLLFFTFTFALAFNLVLVFLILLCLLRGSLAPSSSRRREGMLRLILLALSLRLLRLCFTNLLFESCHLFPLGFPLSESLFKLAQIQPAIFLVGLSSLLTVIRWSALDVDLQSEPSTNLVQDLFESLVDCRLA